MTLPRLKTNGNVPPIPHMPSPISFFFFFGCAKRLSFKAVKFYICLVAKPASYVEDLGFIYRANAEMSRADLRFAFFSFQISP